MLRLSSIFAAAVLIAPAVAAAATPNPIAGIIAGCEVIEYTKPIKASRSQLRVFQLSCDVEKYIAAKFTLLGCSFSQEFLSEMPTRFSNGVPVQFQLSTLRVDPVHCPR